MKKFLAFPFRVVEIAVLTVAVLLAFATLAVACVGLLYRIVGDLIEGC